MFKTNLSIVTKRGLSVLLAVVFATVSIAMPLFAAQPAHAQSVPTDGKWLDAFNIKVGDFVFKIDPITAAVEPEVPDYVIEAGLTKRPGVLNTGLDNQTSNKAPGLAYVKGVASCRDILYVTERGASSGQYQEREKSASGDCANDGDAKKINLSDTGNSKIFAYRQDDDSIFAPLGWTTAGLSECREFKNPVMYRRLPANDPQAPQFDKNQYFLVGNDGNLDTSDYIRTKNDNGDAFIYAKPANFKNCDSLDILLANNGKVATPPPEAYPNFNPETGAYDNSGANEGGDAEDGQGTCEASGFSLSWIICPVFNGLAEATDWIYRSLIEPFLYTPPVSTDPASDSFKVWSSFRVVGNIVLVIGMLVIVFGQSLGGGLIDAYTAKKILPRIIVAAILINLSVYFVAIAVDVSNIVGKGIQQLMFAPFVASGMSNFSLSGTQIAVGTAPLAIMGGLLAGAGAISAGAATGAGIGAALVTLGTAIWPMIGLFVILPAILALIAVFATLILRRALILFLVIVSPIAFALYCLPNTEKYFKKWWELFFKALLVYPIIAVMFALADILALTLLSANGATNSNAIENGLAIVIAFVIQLIPLFVIPFSFKLAGGVIGNLYGTLSGFGKKGGEAIKGNPNDQNSTRNRFKRDFNTKRLNAGLSAGMAGTALNPSLLTRAGRERGRARFAGARLQGLEAERKAFEGSAGWKTAENDSNVTGALAYFESGDAARQGIDFWEEKERQKILSNRSFGVTERNEAFQTLARQREQKMAAVGIAEKLGYNKANRKAALMNAGTIGFETDGGKEGWEQATTAMRSIAGGDAMQYRSMMDEFQYVAKSQAGRADLAANVDGNDAYDLDRATGSQSLYQLLNSKPKTVAALIDEHQARIWDSSASDAERQKSAQFLHEMSNASTKGQGSAGVRDEINAKMGDMNTALDAYTYAQAMSGAPLPTSRDEVVRVSEPDPITGGTVTRVVSRPVTLGSRAEQVAEAQRKARGVIADESRAYVPPDPNNMP